MTDKKCELFSYIVDYKIIIKFRLFMAGRKIDVLIKKTINKKVKSINSGNFENKH